MCSLLKSEVVRMIVGEAVTKRYTKKEFIEMIEKTFSSVESSDVVAVVTQIGEYKGDKNQSVVFSELLKI